MVPPDKRLEPCDNVRLGIDDGLVGEPDLVLGERVAQVLFQYAPVFRGLQQVTGIKAESPLPPPFAA